MTAVIDPDTIDTDIVNKLAACYDSPIEFARHILKLEPTPQQMQFMEAIACPGAHVAVRSGHGTGKSTALAATGIWFLTTRQNALIPCTAPTAAQLNDVLWREVRKLIERIDKPLRDCYRATKDHIYISGSNGMMVARTARPENPDALQGFHEGEILFLIEEASGVCEAVFEVARGALSTPNARVALAGNPTKLTGFFHAAFHKNCDSWTRLHFSCLESSLVAPNYAEDFEREYGADSDIYRIRVLGDFPRHGLLSIISADRVQAALDKKLPPDAVDYAPCILGVDPAWEGSDRSVIAMRKGIFAKILFVGRGLRGDELAARVIHFQNAERADYTFVDKTGVGVSCCDFLRTANRKYTGISFANSAIEPGFMNRRAEIWWRMREWFETDVALAYHQDIMTDLIGPEYGTNDNGKIFLESKDSMRKRGLHSPDLGDALALTFSLPVQGKGFSAVTQNSYGKGFNPFAGIEGRK